MRDEVLRDEKLRLLLRRIADLDWRDDGLVAWLPDMLLFKELPSPTQLAAESRVLLRLLLLP